MNLKQMATTWALASVRIKYMWAEETCFNGAYSLEMPICDVSHKTTKQLIPYRSFLQNWRFVYSTIDSYILQVDLILPIPLFIGCLQYAKSYNAIASK